MEKGFISTQELKKYYRMGTTDVKALDGVDIDIPQGAFCGDHGSFWLRQKHFAQSDWRVRLGNFRFDVCRWPGH